MDMFTYEEEEDSEFASLENRSQRQLELKFRLLSYTPAPPRDEHDHEMSLAGSDFLLGC